MPVKIFVGNLPNGVTGDVIRSLFEYYGLVSDCDVLGTYGFVHMETDSEADTAIEQLNGYLFHGVPMKVELSTEATQGKRKNLRLTTKIFIGNIKIGTTNQQLREVFEPYGEVSESEVVGGYGFVHMAEESQAQAAIKDLNGFKLNGSLLNVELSTRETQGKSKTTDVYAGERSRAGMMPWGPARGRGRGMMSSRFDPYSAPAGSSWMPRSDPYSSMHIGDGYGARPDDISFARELLQLYSKDPAAFDAYARNPQVRRSLNLDPDPTGYMAAGQGMSGRAMASGYSVSGFGRGPRAVTGGMQPIRPSELYMSFE